MAKDFIREYTGLSKREQKAISKSFSIVKKGYLGYIKRCANKSTPIQRAEKQYQHKGYYETDTEGKPIFRNRYGFFTRGHGIVHRHYNSPYNIPHKQYTDEDKYTKSGKLRKSYMKEKIRDV